jgi:hypothetical protein
MKPIILAAVAGMALAGLPAVATAACAAPSVRVATTGAMTTLLQGNTVCSPAVTQPTMEAQELHQAGGALVDYKRGPTDKGDPSTQVGSWNVTGGRSAFVTHDYGSGAKYTYAVWTNSDGTHSFCSANPEIRVRIKLGGGPC